MLRISQKSQWLPGHALEGPAEDVCCRETVLFRQQKQVLDHLELID